MSMMIGGPEVTSSSHPAARELENILVSIAETFKSSLLYFTVDHGIARFQFDNEELTREMARYLTNSR
jgi:hypothetical protein